MRAGRIVTKILVVEEFVCSIVVGRVWPVQKTGIAKISEFL
jgi:hypothetical protein